MNKAKPSATARTISLFTGMADVDDPEPGRARDGTGGEAPRRLPARKGLKWGGGVTRWAVVDGPRGDSYVVEKIDGQYRAAYYSEKLGAYPDVITAGDACERHHERQR